MNNRKLAFVSEVRTMFCGYSSKILPAVGRQLYPFRFFLLAAIILAFILIPQIITSPYIIRIFIMCAVYAILGFGLNILTGYTGLLSLGHAGFYAIGAYTTALLMMRLNINFFAALLGGALFSGFIGLLIGLPSLRLNGTYLSIVTIGFGEIVKMIIMNLESVTNGTLGLKNIPRPSIFGYEFTLANGGMFYLVYTLLGLVALSCFLLINSKIGRAFRAIKNDEFTASLMGIKTTKYKILAFVISAMIAGIAGGYYATLINYIDHNSFTFDISILIVSIVILGGMGTIRGVLLGSAILIVFPEISRPFMEWRFVIYGLILVVMMRFRPQGLLGWRSIIPYRIPHQKEWSADTSNMNNTERILQLRKQFDNNNVKKKRSDV